MSGTSGTFKPQAGTHQLRPALPPASHKLQESRSFIQTLATSTVWTFLATARPYLHLTACCVIDTDVIRKLQLLPLRSLVARPVADFNIPWGHVTPLLASGQGVVSVLCCCRQAQGFSCETERHASFASSSLHSRPSSHSELMFRMST